jgi:hypothetical protein
MRLPQPGQKTADSGMRAAQSGQDNSRGMVAFIVAPPVRMINLALTRRQAKCNVSSKF